MTKFIGKVYIALHESAGANANLVSPVWNVGVHKFDTNSDRTYRVVYFKSKNGRWYSEISFPRKDAVGICEG